MKPRGPDPIFKLPTPLMFAHRGGAKEVPESTELAFRHAIKHRTDVLELDIQVTASDDHEEEQFVVWHGPGLDNVRLARDDQGPRRRRKITQYKWSELDKQAWVADPGSPKEKLSHVPQDSDRLLLTLERFLQLFPDERLNIELKWSVKRRHLPRFIKILEAHNPRRVGVVASNLNEWLIQSFKRQAKGRFATNTPFLRSVLYRAAAGIHVLGLLDLQHKALQFPHPRWACPTHLVKQTHAAGGGIYVFLTKAFVIPAHPAEALTGDTKALFELLDRGVDGVMTDRPRHIRAVLDAWTRL